MVIIDIIKIVQASGIYEIKITYLPSVLRGRENISKYARETDARSTEREGSKQRKGNHSEVPGAQDLVALLRLLKLERVRGEQKSGFVVNRRRPCRGVYTDHEVLAKQICVHL